MNIRTAPPMDKAAFWRWVERQERRFELVDGVPRMLPYVTRNHERIVTNIVLALASRLDRDAWDIATGDFAIETGVRSIRFADVMVHPFVADDPMGRLTSVAPLLVEVLSDSTEHVDFGQKLAEYRGLDGVGAYLICASRRLSAWLWVRGPDGARPDDPQIAEDQHGSIDCPDLAISLPLAEIYARVTFP